MAPLLIPVFAFAIFTFPAAIAAFPILALPPGWERIAAVLAAPTIFLAAHVLVAGALSRVGKPAIIKGQFPRQLTHPVYGRRRIYGVCWTAIYYFTPLYFVCLTVPALKTFLFRLFGYAGSTDFVIYPDAWIRDLPLLELDEGAYVANRCTIGTNMCLSDGTVLVDSVKIGKKAMVGHLAMVGPGVILGDGSELGVHTAVGIRSRLHEGARTGICATIFHGVEVGAGTEIGACSYIGLRAKIGADLKIPAGANIPAGAVIESQQDVLRYHSSESATLNKAREAGLKIIMGASKGAAETDAAQAAEAYGDARESR